MKFSDKVWAWSSTFGVLFGINVFATASTEIYTENVFNIVTFIFAVFLFFIGSIFKLRGE